MTRICAWCQNEGKSGILGKGPSGKDGKKSHGICKLHLLRLKEKTEQYVANQATITQSPFP